MHALCVVFGKPPTHHREFEPTNHHTHAHDTQQGSAVPRGVYTFDAHPLMMAGGVALSALPSRSELVFWGGDGSTVYPFVKKRSNTSQHGKTKPNKQTKTGTFKTYSADVWKKDKDVLYLQVSEKRGSDTRGGRMHFYIYQTRKQEAASGDQFRSTFHVRRPRAFQSSR